MCGDLGDLKVGDYVFVVWQRSRHQERESDQHRTEIAKIVKVGRKYAYFQQDGWVRPFDKLTGVSVHNVNDTARSNGQGFDVYKSRQEWERYQYAVELQKNLEKRMKKNSWSFIDLPLDVLEKIHAILDEVQQRKG